MLETPTRGGDIAVTFKKRIYFTRIRDIPGVQYLSLTLSLPSLSYVAIRDNYMCPISDASILSPMSYCTYELIYNITELAWTGKFNLPEVD